MLIAGLRRHFDPCKLRIYQALNKFPFPRMSHRIDLPSSERTIRRLVLVVFTFCDTLCNASLVHNCHGVFLSLSITSICNIHKNCKCLCDNAVFYKENVRNPVWICRGPISMILVTRFSLILGTRR